MANLSHNQQIGHIGEDIAANYVSSELGMTILERNWMRNNKELDIIAIKGDTLRIIEVKSRKESSEDTIASSLNDKKLRYLIAGASHYASSVRLDGINDIFFDLVVVIFSDDGSHRVEYTPKFFYPTW
ncbi:MAG: YraN family protein [Rikenellaceae bacterium]